MATRKTKTLRDVTTVATIGTDKFIPITDGNGNVTKVSLASLKSALLGGIDLESVNDNIFIMYHRKSDDFPLAVKTSKWASLQNSGEIADGVLVMDGDKFIVVAPTEATLKWSSSDVSGGGTTTSDRVTAFADFNGKQNTASQITHNECSGTSYAPGYCHSYSRANANGKGLTAGKWWLPSMGELMVIYANMKKINYALSLISGASQLVEDAYWSSTEASASSAWLLYLNVGSAYYWGTKTTTQHRVRPVSAFVS